MDVSSVCMSGPSSSSSSPAPSHSTLCNDQSAWNCFCAYFEYVYVLACEWLLKIINSLLGCCTKSGSMIYWIYNFSQALIKHKFFWTSLGMPEQRHSCREKNCMNSQDIDRIPFVDTRCLCSIITAIVNHDSGIVRNVMHGMNEWSTIEIWNVSQNRECAGSFFPKSESVGLVFENIRPKFAHALNSAPTKAPNSSFKMFNGC